MPIHWDKIPHREIAIRIYRGLGHNSVKRSAESSLRHMLRRRLQFLNAEDHRRFIELEANDIVAYLRCVRDEYRAFVDEHNCQPVLEAYWVVLRCAIFPSALATIRTAIVDYLKQTRVAGRDSLLFGIPTRSCYREDPIRRLRGPDLKNDTPATDDELQVLANIVNENTLAFFRDIHDGGAVWIPYGGGPFSLDDGLATRRSWGLSAVREQVLVLQCLVRK